MTDEACAPRLTARRESGGELVLALAGDLDLACAERLRNEVLPAVEQGVTVLDLSGVGFCDSSGLRVLLEADRRAKTAETSLRLAAPSEPVRRLFDLTKADRVLQVFPDLGSALKSERRSER